MAIRTIEELEKHIQLNENEKEWDEDGKNTLPLLISKHLEPLLNEKAIRRQFVPTHDENTDAIGNLDPQMEKEYSITDRFVRRYENRGAFLVTDNCFAYCRHCFRRRFTKNMIGKCSKLDIEKVASYLKEHKEIKEVLLTGGDIFTLTDDELLFLLSKLKEAREDIIYRLCTRALTSNPSRFTPSLFSVLEKVNYGAPFYLLTQFNHALEISEEAIEKIKCFVKLGIPMMNQCVLLKGVNDSVEEQVELCNKLLFNRIKPYYLFQGDLVQGTAHLRVSLEKGIEIEREMRKRLSGLAMPQYTMDLPSGGGKVPICGSYIKGKENNIWKIETLEGEIRQYPEG